MSQFGDVFRAAPSTSGFNWRLGAALVGNAGLWIVLAAVVHHFI